MRKPHIAHRMHGWWCVDAKDDWWPMFGGNTPLEAYRGWICHKEDIGDLHNWITNKAEDEDENHS